MNNIQKLVILNLLLFSIIFSQNEIDGVTSASKDIQITGGAAYDTVAILDLYHKDSYIRHTVAFGISLDYDDTIIVADTPRVRICTLSNLLPETKYFVYYRGDWPSNPELENHGCVGSFRTQATFHDTRSPKVTMISSNESDTLIAKYSGEIVWSFTDNIDTKAASVIALLTTNNMNTWGDTLKTTQTSDTSMVWKIPDFKTNHCRIKLIVFDKAGNSSSDISKTTFRIAPTTPISSVKILSKQTNCCIAIFDNKLIFSQKLQYNDEIKVLSSNGRILFSRMILNKTSNIILLPTFPAGVYTVFFKSRNGSQSVRLLTIL